MMIYVGTTNPGKVREFAGILRPFNLDFEPVSFDDVEEPWDTFVENVEIKALEYRRRIDCDAPEKMVICEDSGLIVPTINGLPCVYSARFDDTEINDELEVVDHHSSGRSRDEIDEANNARLLSMMEDVGFENRGAYFELSIAICVNDELVHTLSAR